MILPSRSCRRDKEIGHGRGAVASGATQPGHAPGILNSGRHTVLIMLLVIALLNEDRIKLRTKIARIEQLLDPCGRKRSTFRIHDQRGASAAWERKQKEESLY